MSWHVPAPKRINRSYIQSLHYKHRTEQHRITIDVVFTIEQFFSLAASLLVNADSILKVLQSRQIEWSSVCRSGYSVQTHYKYLYSSSHWIDVCACVFVEYVRLWCVQNGIESQRYIEKKIVNDLLVFQSTCVEQNKIYNTNIWIVVDI